MILHKIVCKVLSVMIPSKESENLKFVLEGIEQQSIYEVVQARRNTSASEYVSYDDAMKQKLNDEVHK